MESTKKARCMVFEKMLKKYHRNSRQLTKVWNLLRGSLVIIENSSMASSTLKAALLTGYLAFQHECTYPTCKSVLIGFYFKTNYDDISKDSVSCDGDPLPNVLAACEIRQTVLVCIDGKIYKTIRIGSTCIKYIPIEYHTLKYYILPTIQYYTVTFKSIKK